MLIQSFLRYTVPAGNQKLYKSPFLRDFWHLNVAMMTSNNALVPDSDKEDAIASGPFEWPFLWNGMRMNGWSDTGVKYYLIGNVVTWWGSSISLLVFLPTLLWHLGRFQRKKNDFAPGECLFDVRSFRRQVADVFWFQGNGINSCMYRSLLLEVGHSIIVSQYFCCP